jgi:hypothetical protein
VNQAILSFFTQAFLYKLETRANEQMLTALAQAHSIMLIDK